LIGRLESQEDRELLKSKGIPEPTSAQGGDNKAWRTQNLKKFGKKDSIGMSTGRNTTQASFRDYGYTNGTARESQWLNQSITPRDAITANSIHRVSPIGHRPIKTPINELRAAFGTQIRKYSIS